MRVEEIWMLTRDEWRNLPFMGMLKDLIAGEQFRIVTPTNHDITVMCEGGKATATNRASRTFKVGETIGKLRNLLAQGDLSTKELMVRVGRAYGAVYTALTNRHDEFEHIDDGAGGKAWHMKVRGKLEQPKGPIALHEAMTAMRADGKPMALNALRDATGRGKGTLHGGLKAGLKLGLVKKNENGPGGVTWELTGNGRATVVGSKVNKVDKSNKPVGRSNDPEAERKYTVIKAYILSHGNSCRVKDIAAGTKLHGGAVSWHLRVGGHSDEFEKIKTKWAVRKGA